MSATSPASDTQQVYWTAADLMAANFPPPRWAVPGLVSEGVNLLVSQPKVGKSWLALNLSVAVASGGTALGRVPVERGDVLYLALEDNARRLQRRLGTVLAGQEPPAGLAFATAIETMDAGGAETICRWVSQRTDARLVIVDVFAKVRGATGSSNAYEADYEAMGRLKRIADDHEVALLLVHHTRKQAADDFLSTVSGTNGIAGAADTLLLLSRGRTSADATLQITGRDVEEDEHALQFDSQHGSWTMLEGPASDFALSDTRRVILEYLRETGGARPRDVSTGLELKADLVRQTLTRMSKDGQIDTDGKGLYFPLDAPSRSVPEPQQVDTTKAVTAVTAVTPLRLVRATGMTP